MIKEKSCGMVVFNEENNNLYILMVHHNMGHWGLPKGHVEENETEIETAIREVLEETGIETKVVSDFREVITYSPRENNMKDIAFFIGKPIGGKILPQLTEVQSVEWLEINDALNKDFHGDVKMVINKAFNYYQENLIKGNFYNEDNLTKKDIDETVIRTKALLINSKNEILLGYCNKTYQFPGGHLEEGESISDCLIREIREETGIELEKKIYIPFFLTRYYTKNYRSTMKNRENIIYYFVVYTDTFYNLENTAFDEREKIGNYTLKYIHLDSVREVLNNSIEDNPINKVITKEMLEALKNLEV